MDNTAKTTIVKTLRNLEKQDKPQVLVPFNLQSDKKNQFFIFLKPEVFLDRKIDQVEKIIDLAFEKFSDHQVEISGAALFPGEALEKLQIMDKHYGAINELSKTASRLDPKVQKEVRDAVGANEWHPVLGGHEVVKMFPDLSPEELDKMWLSEGSTRIKSGFYARLMKIFGKELVVVNGFHPKQLVHYTGKDREILVMIGSSDSSWKTLREDLIGDTFPEKALPSSIRGHINRNAKDFGFDAVTIANNVIHFSAGPSEALFEIDNFLGDSFMIDIFKNKAVLAQKLAEAGMSPEQIRPLLTDKSLHSEAELKDTNEVVEIISRRVTSD